MEVIDRRIKFEKVGNCRDLGGLVNQNGAVIRRGCLLRSALLQEATDADAEALQKTWRLTKVIDLRSRMEFTEKPDRPMEGVEEVNIPTLPDPREGVTHDKKTEEEMRQERRRHGPPKMEVLYQMMASQEPFRSNLGKAIQTIMEHDFDRGSILWHCAEGKDRCGIVSAMLLAALGVDRGTIMEDYLITNETNLAKGEQFYQMMLERTGDKAMAEAMRGAVIAKETYLQSVFDVIDNEYGGDEERYLLEGLHIPRETLDSFREKMLSN